MADYVYKCPRCGDQRDVSFPISASRIRMTRVHCNKCPSRTLMKKVPQPFSFSFTQTGHRS